MRCLVVLLALASTTAFAQPRLTLSQFQTGRLSAGEQDRLRVTAAAGDLREVHVEADFDPTAEVLAPDGARVAYDDDGGHGVNSYVARVAAPRSGAATLVVGSYQNRGAGRYDAIVRRLGGRGYQACDDSRDADVLPQPGTRVVLGRHRSVGGDDNWADDMNEYIGRETTVTDVSAPDSEGCPVVKVSIDDSEFVWRARDLTLAD